MAEPETSEAPLREQLSPAQTNSRGNGEPLDDNLSTRISVDAERLKKLVSLAAQALVTLGADAESYSFSMRSAQRALASIELLDLRAAATGVADLAVADPERFAAGYGRFVGHLDGLGWAVDTVAERLEGGSRTEQQQQALVDLLSLRLQDLHQALESVTEVSSRALAEVELRASAEQFGRRVRQLVVEVQEAATEFGLEVKKLDWGVYSEEESRAADRWRMIALAGLVASFVMSVLGVIHAVGSSDAWPTVSLKVLASGSLLAVAAYGSKQSGEHRSAARQARRTAIDLATIAPFTARLDEAGRQEVFRSFGLSLFSPKPVAQTGDQEDISGAVAQLLTVLAQKYRA
jgi:hypothetical protein